MGEPGFWDDQERAAQISTEHSRVARKLERYEQLTRDFEDAQELFSMDGGMEDEIAPRSTPAAGRSSRASRKTRSSSASTTPATRS